MSRQDVVRLFVRVYVVTSADLFPGRSHLDVARAAVDGGATAVQLRGPELERRPQELIAVARAVAELCDEKDVRFIVNNAVDVALEAAAEGVHVGQDDDVGRARRRLGSARYLGVSVETPDQARRAEELGADYLGVTVFGTRTKPEAKPIGLEGLRNVVAATSLPVVGIGGVDASNAGDVLSAGAAGVAAVSAVGAAEDPVRATRDLAAAVTRFFDRHDRGERK